MGQKEPIINREVDEKGEMGQITLDEGDKDRKVKVNTQEKMGDSESSQESSQEKMEDSEIETQEESQTEMGQMDGEQDKISQSGKESGKKQESGA